MMDQILNNEESRNRLIKIAVVSFDSLGDSLLYILLAYNLHQNHYDVTFIGNVGDQLSEWIPDIKILPYPELDFMEEALAHYDLVINSPRRMIRAKLADDPEYLAYLRSKYLLVCQKTPESWVFDHTQRLSKQLRPELFNAVSSLAKASGSIRFRHFRDESAVDILCAYMREKLQLSKVTRYVQITPPSNLRYRQYFNRIIVSPDSAGPEDKNWGEQQFLSLCRQLKKSGYQPVIVVSPANYNKWELLNRAEFEMPLFNSIGDLAAYIYESAVVIANDSGNGHLASFLGLPVVTIYKKRNPKFHWRPDWSPVSVVFPKLVIKLFNYRIWKPFVTVRMVLDAIKKQLKFKEDFQKQRLN